MQLFVPINFTRTNWSVKISGGKVKLFAREDGTRSYLTDRLTATALTGTNGAAYLGDTGGGPVFIPSSRFNGSSTLNLLFEVGEIGKFSLNTELMLGNEVLCTNRVWLKILDVKSIYDQWVVADLDTDWPSVDYVPPTAAVRTDVDAEVLAQLTGNTDYVLFVHGWNMKQWEKEAFGSTAFKRLWWQGYRGRYGTFRWPTYQMDGIYVLSALANYDCSEYNSWRSALALTNVLVQLNATTLCQGNVQPLRFASAGI